MERGGEALVVEDEAAVRAAYESDTWAVALRANDLGQDWETST